MGWVSARRFGHLSFWSTRSSLPDPGPVVLPFLAGRTIRGPRLAPSLRTRVLGRPEDQLRDNELIPMHSRSPGPQDAQDGAGSGRPSHAPGEWRGRTPAADRLRHNERPVPRPSSPRPLPPSPTAPAALRAGDRPSGDRTSVWSPGPPPHVACPATCPDEGWLAGSPTPASQAGSQAAGSLGGAPKVTRTASLMRRPVPGARAHTTLPLMAEARPARVRVHHGPCGSKQPTSFPSRSKVRGLN